MRFFLLLTVLIVGLVVEAADAFARMEPTDTAKAAEQICASYTHTPDGEIGRDKCKAVIHLKLGRWLALIPLIGDVDYVAVCAPHSRPEDPGTPEQLFCAQVLGSTVLWVRSGQSPVRPPPNTRPQ